MSDRKGPLPASSHRFGVGIDEEKRLFSVLVLWLPGD
jgi:hypothetical protein